jgi:hypothetical protein
VSQDLVQERRRKRYEEESLLQVTYYTKRKRKTEDLQIIYKDKSLKKFYGKPYEHKFDNLDRGCDLQAIDQFSNVGGSDAAVVGLNYGEIHNHKQSLAIESNYISEIGKICLTSETNPKVLIELVS